MTKASTTGAAPAAGKTTESAPRSSPSSSGTRSRAARSKTKRAEPSAKRKASAKSEPCVVHFPPPLTLNGEDPRFWEAIYAGIQDAVQPADLLDDFWAYNMACIAYDVVRYRSQRDVILFNLRHEGLEDLLAGLVPPDKIQEFSIQYRIQDTEVAPDGSTSLKAKLKSLGVTEERITAATWLNRIDDVERIERMMMQAEARLFIMQRESHRRAEARMRLAEATPRIINAATDERGRSAGVYAASPGHEALEGSQDQFPDE